jgi:hypothetical protein
MLSFPTSYFHENSTRLSKCKKKRKKAGTRTLKNVHHIVMRIYLMIIAEIIKLLLFPLFCAVKKLAAHCECKKPKLGLCFSFVTAQDILDSCLHV